MEAAELLRQYAAGQRDFNRVDLRGADLRGADLRGADLREANLYGTNLSGADLIGANLREADLGEADLIRTEITWAKLIRANLRKANLRWADLDKANLSGANLSGANLRWATLIGADLIGADLVGAHLRGADLSRAILIRADLGEANLIEANLSGAILTHAGCRGLILQDSILANIDLTPLCEANVKHEGPSTVDWRSVAMSLRSARLGDFLLRTGMPHVFVDYMIDCAKSLSEVDLFRMLQSTFISYGGPNEPFAIKLSEALQKNGVSTFCFALHAGFGDKLHDVMRDGVNKYDRMILVCSEAALNRHGVQNEIEQLLAREARDGGKNYLIPIRLDDYLFSGWNPPKPGMAQEIRDRVVADFRGTDTDETKFNAQLLRLLDALKKSRP